MATTFQSGDTLGRYRIERLLGRGAMGEVYLARDPQIDRPLAVKTLRLVDGEPRGLANRFSGGGPFRRGRILELPLGVHRVTLIAPGRRRVDFAVDVTAGATRDRQRVEITLPPLPAGAPE